jgi:hypothetical protein
MPTEDDPRLQGYQPSSDFTPRDSDRSSRQILDFPGRKPKNLALNPAELVYGYWEPNDLSTPQTAILTNTGYEDLPIASIRSVGEWTVTSDCPSTLRPGETCSITAYFNPLSSGLKTGAIYVDTGDATGDEAVQLMGAGKALPGDLNAVPPFLNFFDVTMLTDSETQIVTLSNNGMTTAPLLNLTVDGEFEMTHNCETSLVPGASCQITVNMAPLTAGNKVGNVTILHKIDPTSDVNVSLVVPLYGTALSNVTPTPATALFSPVPVVFGDTQIETPSTVRILTMQNIGQEFLDISGFSLDTGFSQTNNCGVGLAGGASCQITLTMVPPEVGLFEGNLVVTHSGLGIDTIPLSGLGISADVVEFTAPLTVLLPDALADEETFVIFSILGDNLEDMVLTTLPVDTAEMTFTFSASPSGPFTTMTTYNLAATTSLYVRAVYTGPEVGEFTEDVTVASTTPLQTETITITVNVIEPTVFLWDDIFVDMTSFGGLDWSGAGWGTTSALPADPALNFFMWERLPTLAPEASIIRLESPTGTMHLSRRWEMVPSRLATNYTIDLMDTIVERSKASGSPYWGMLLAWGEVVANAALPTQPAVGVNAAIGDTFITLKNDADTTTFLGVAGPGSIVELRTNTTAAGYHPPESRQTIYIKNIVGRVLELYRPLEITAPVNNNVGGFESSDPSNLQLLVGSLLQSNAARGATSIVVQNATGFEVGDWIELSTSEVPQPAGNQFSALWLDAMLSDIAQADNPDYFGNIGMNTELNQITGISGTTFTLREPLRKNKLTAWQGAAVKINPIQSMEVRGGKFEGAVGAVNTSAEAWEHQYIWARYCVDSLFRNGQFDTLGRAINVRRKGQCVRLDTGWNSLVTGNTIARGGSIDAGEGYGVSMRLGERNSIASYNEITNCRHGVEFWSSGGGCIAEHNTLINGTSSDIDTHGSWNVDVTIRNNYFTNDGLLKSPDIGTDGWPDAIRVGNNKFLFDDGITILNNTVEDYNGNAFAMVPGSMNVLVDGLIVTNVRRVVDLGQNSRHKKAVLKNLTVKNLVVDTVTHRIIHMYGDGLVPFNFDNVLFEDWQIGGPGALGLVVDGTSNTDPKDTSTYIQRFRNLTLRNMLFGNMETPTDLAYVLDIRYGSTLLLDNIEIDGGLRGITLRTVTGITGNVTITSIDTLHAFNEGGFNTGDTGVLDINWVPGSTPTITKASTGLTVNVT